MCLYELHYYNNRTNNTLYYICSLFSRRLSRGLCDQSAVPLPAPPRHLLCRGLVAVRVAVLIKLVVLHGHLDIPRLAGLYICTAWGMMSIDKGEERVYTLICVVHI